MRSLRKRNSWPPLRKPRSFYVTAKIDEDPFAYFISPADDRNVFFEDGLAAGIHNHRRTRSLSPSHDKPRNASFSYEEAANSPVAKLKRWIMRMEKFYLYRKPPCKESPPEQRVKVPETRSPLLRGRSDNRTSSANRVTQNLRSPPRRLRAWREPSADLWPVPEEQEDFGLGITG